MDRRIIAVSSNAELAPALEAADARIETCTYEALAPIEPEPALWVLDLDPARAGAQISAIPGTAPILGVLAGGTIEQQVELFQVSDRVAGFVLGDDVAAVARRVLEPQPPAALLVEGVPIVARDIGDHEDKSACLAEAAAVVERRAPKLREPIEQCVDELLMNALYAAPVDAGGQRVFMGIPVKRRIGLRTAAVARLEYGADARRFVITVRDAFGSLDRATVLRVLHKSIHAEDKVDRKAGGAGLGLYLLASSASAVYFDVVPGVRCEITCAFELAAPPRPAQLLFVRRDPTGEQGAAPARALRSAAARRRLVRRAAAVTGATALAAAIGFASLGPGADQIAIEAPPGATIDVDGRQRGTGAVVLRDVGYEPHFVVVRLAGHAPVREVVRAPSMIEASLAPLARIELDSQPSDARVELGGKLIGTTPLAITSLPPRSRTPITLVKPGHARATVQLEAPAAGEVARVVHPLSRAADVVRVRVVSDPPGAEVLRDGQTSGADRTYTPADVYVKAGQRERITLVMRHHAPLAVEVDGTDGNVVRGELVPADE